MRSGTVPQPPRRAWAVFVSFGSEGPVLRCLDCGPLPRAAGAGPRAAPVHLGDHARRAALPRHLRICQCRDDGCRLHHRHRGCDGALVLLLAFDPRGRCWRLADTCGACAAATPHSAAVPETENRQLPDCGADDRTALGPENGDGTPGPWLWWPDEQHAVF